jgi:DNA replication and repair protein RecF
MFIERLKLHNFKNHKNTNWLFSPGNNLITGRNGTGKTNLLDAIHMICLGKSYFSGRENQILQWDADFYRLEASIYRGEVPEKIVVKFDGKNKKIEKDDLPVKSIADHVGQYPCTVVAPEDIALILGQSDIRRKLIDQTLCQTDATYLKYLMQYNLLLKQRNALLKQQNPKTILLDSYDASLLSLGAFIHTARIKYFKEIMPDVTKLHAQLSGGQDQIDISYSSQLSSEDFATLLYKNRHKDILYQRTHAGIHKDDIAMLIQKAAFKSCASQGQIKTMVFVLKIAQYQYLRKNSGIKPILILDDVFDKLDPFRIEYLFKILKDKNEFGQVFISDTNANRISQMSDWSENPENKTFIMSKINGLEI